MNRWSHPEDELLDAFVACELDESTAVSVALHLDECPGCNARAEERDPLAGVFACIDDPQIPHDLTTDILKAAAAQKNPHRVQPEPFIAVVLMAAASLLLVSTGLPDQLLPLIDTLGGAGVTVVASIIDAPAILSPLWVAFAALGLGASVFTAAHLEARRSA